MKEREFINWLADQYAGRRSDVTDLCEEYLRTGKKPVKAIPEHRYVRAMIPESIYEVEYDTLTTEIMYHKPLCQWLPCEHHEYYDDDDEEKEQ